MQHWLIKNECVHETSNIFMEMKKQKYISNHGFRCLYFRGAMATEESAETVYAVEGVDSIFTQPASHRLPRFSLSGTAGVPADMVLISTHAEVHM